jgi:ornithine decarboxylase
MHYLQIAIENGVKPPDQSEWKMIPLTDNLETRHLAAVVTQTQQAFLTTDLPLPQFTANTKWTTVLAAAAAYERQMIPTYLRDLLAFAQADPVSFATPGHHSGQFLKQGPAGAALETLLGDTFLKADVSDSVPTLGDMLTHGGSALAAEKFAAQTFGADEAYFVTNGTTSANAICSAAALAPGDFVLFDRNSHKSLYNGALVMTGSTPVYLPTARNQYGLIGGVPAAAFDEATLRAQVTKIDPVQARKSHPFRLAVLQLDTYDGQYLQLPYVLKQLRGLCDYLLLDAAWAGYEHFLPLLASVDPGRQTYGPDDPGILVTQSLHKQQAGLAQTSQILKFDHHLKGQARYIDAYHFNHAYLKFVTTSFSYPLYASAASNAYLQQGQQGQQLWQTALINGIDFRKQVFQTKLFRPFVPKTVQGKAWQDWDTDQLATDPQAWYMPPNADWHGFSGYDRQQYVNDPLKVTLCSERLPGPLVNAYLMAQEIIPEKNDLFSTLFLVTPGSTAADWQRLFQALQRLEHAYLAKTPLKLLLPAVAPAFSEQTVNAFADQMAAELRYLRLIPLHQRLFQANAWGQRVYQPQAADAQLIRNQATWVPLEKIVGKVAAEGALPYPPGVFVVAPGERWTTVAQHYFEALGTFMQAYPGFEFEIQGVRYTDGLGEALVLVG